MNIDNAKLHPEQGPLSDKPFNVQISVLDRESILLLHQLFSDAILTLRGRREELDSRGEEYDRLILAETRVHHMRESLEECEPDPPGAN